MCVQYGSHGIAHVSRRNAHENDRNQHEALIYINLPEYMYAYIRFAWIHTLCLDTYALLGYIRFAWTHTLCLDASSAMKLHPHRHTRIPHGAFTSSYTHVGRFLLLPASACQIELREINARFSQHPSSSRWNFEKWKQASE